MLTLTLYDTTHIALHGAYPWREEIKALATWPDVRYEPTVKAWLLHVALIEKLYAHLGDVVAPASVDFWMRCPLTPERTQKPAKRRKSKQEVMMQKRMDSEAAGKVGRAIVGLMHEQEA